MADGISVIADGGLGSATAISLGYPKVALAASWVTAAGDLDQCVIVNHRELALSSIVSGLDAAAAEVP
jgi:hypothetical protein